MANASYPTSGRGRQPQASSSEQESADWKQRNRDLNGTIGAPNMPIRPEELGKIEGKAQADYQKGAASAVPAAAPLPRPQLPDTARYGVMKRNGVDASGKEYGFVGVGANGQGNVTTDTYEKAREFSQGQRSMPQVVTPAVAGTAFTPATPEVKTGPAPTSLPYQAPVAGQQRGFSQDGSRDVMAPAIAPAAAPVQPQYMAQAPANPVVVQSQPASAPAPVPVQPPAPDAQQFAPSGGTGMAPPLPRPASAQTAAVVDTAPTPATTPINAPTSMADSIATGVANFATSKGPFAAIGENVQAGRAKQKAKETAGRARARPRSMDPMGDFGKRKPALPSVNDTAPSPFRQVADVGLPPINPIGKSRPRASLV